MGLKETLENALTNSNAFSYEMLIQNGDNDFLLMGVKHTPHPGADFGHGGYAGKSILEQIIEARDEAYKFGNSGEEHAYNYCIELMERGRNV